MFYINTVGNGDDLWLKPLSHRFKTGPPSTPLIMLIANRSPLFSDHRRHNRYPLDPAILCRHFQVFPLAHQDNRTEGEVLPGRIWIMSVIKLSFSLDKICPFAPSGYKSRAFILGVELNYFFSFVSIFPVRTYDGLTASFSCMFGSLDTWTSALGCVYRLFLFFFCYFLRLPLCFPSSPTQSYPILSHFLPLFFSFIWAIIIFTKTF